MKQSSIKRLVTVAMLVAMEIILTRFLSIQTPIVRIGFGFLPLAVIGILYGPLYAALGAVAGDLIGFVLFPTGAFFPGFTLTAALTGTTYGVLLHKREKNTARVCIAVLIVTLILNLGLDTLWLKIIMGQGYLGLLPPRIIKCVVMIPVQFLLIRFMTSERVYVGFLKKLTC